MLKGKKFLITGGAGFIGGALARRLNEMGSVITCYDNLSHGVTPTDVPWQLLIGDVLDRASLREAMEGAENVIHCAAVAGVESVTRQPVLVMRTNMIGTANILEIASRQTATERVILFSTSEVFGARAYRAKEKDEAHLGDVSEARWGYAASKRAAEHLGIAYHRQYGLPITILRPFNVYGPGQIGESAMKTFIVNALKGEALTIHGDGTQIRAWCYIDDMVDATMAAISRQEAVGESFNVGNPHTAITVNALAETVIGVLGSGSKMQSSNPHFPDVDLRVPNIDKARRLLNFDPHVGLREGILRTAAFYGEVECTPFSAHASP